ncbi:tRNA-binding protein [Natrialbaceae archaeon AArc-T1-2]|uniref:tRNA-binding protein n=1 Tax=Natrialbaceae archaeon AArc-T1-2 TaxID=3053904 RepID=UPI00255B0E8C|nr:tRNA-binding protein [Natrialbaceae archaeon AArc-T1-2]WIV68547.1 tRNA-binding protein [Natrialbaceae archaeon AArc-T1-2]
MVENPFDDEIRVGEVREATAFPETNKPRMVKLWIDLGDEEVRSAAQLGYNHDPDTLPGRQVLCATTLGTVRIAGFESEALTVCVPDEDGHPVLVEPDREVPLGGLLF